MSDFSFKNWKAAPPQQQLALAAEMKRDAQRKQLEHYGAQLKNRLMGESDAARKMELCDIWREVQQALAGLPPPQAVPDLIDYSLRPGQIAYSPRPSLGPDGSPIGLSAGYWSTPPNWPTITTVPPPPPTFNFRKLAQLQATAPQVVPVARPAMRVPDLISCVVGWRMWMISAEGELQAIAHTTRWPARQQAKATCQVLMTDSDTHTPDLNCSCGFWAFRPEVAARRATAHDYICHAAGLVSLWGRVIEHEDGWRAEFAYPKELWFTDPKHLPVAARYGVPARVA